MDYNLKLAVQILEQTPNTLQSFLGNLSNDWVFCNEGENTWNAFDIVGHLIHGEMTDWIPRLKIIISNDENKTFSSFYRFAQMEISKGKTLQKLLDEFSLLRKQNLNYLNSLNLSEEQLKLKGIHPELGEVTLKELLACWVAHDLGHISQVARVMAKQYKNQVGPWLAYLPILNK